jgi:hypothetical protein
MRLGDCVRTPDGRIGRVRGASGTSWRVRVRRTSSDTHQFLVLDAAQLDPVDCPTGWMSPDGYRRYLRVTLTKMREREAVRGKRRRARPHKR